MASQIRWNKVVLGLSLALAGGILLGACSLPVGQPAPENQLSPAPPTQNLSLLATLTQQAVEKENQAPTPEPSATPQPTETAASIPPTNSPGPGQDAPAPDPVEVKFRLGGTMMFLQGDLAAGQQVSYSLGAAGGQTLLAGVSSNDQEVYFEIVGLEDGSVLVPFSARSSSLEVNLPATQAYQITLYSPTDNVYFLSVEIPANLTVYAGAGPYFIDGYVDVLAHFHPDVMTRVRYLLALQEGTVLNVQLTSPALQDLTLALTGREDGQPYLRHVVKSEAISGFAVPASQGYYLDVYSVSGVSAGFRLQIEVLP